ncbi:uncharacterized protein LACBIDRAFT_316911 [Laccaria bicolor S238N-H82]|uniref:Predicted protein n=1 Tax=Laccaria bicolor (strain S238N-H82 / ATCC MYA-4686) TaxID=486041 RepID=B0D594_LACBS|nr:uncharacterized protein LACBIDRAFT_316911 [Laccaria bicolor S238N-H82]EDR10477.1 predicted protein [Laccaria bicolor S238N-H82]|eukprot:XP_001878927.1 predicted protein [Laccaria bicolor S238N-H82]
MHSAQPNHRSCPGSRFPTATLDHNGNKCEECGLPVELCLAGPRSKISGQLYFLCVRKDQHHSGDKWWQIFQVPSQ